MRTRQLGNTDLQITYVGFGSWAVGGGDWSFGWGSQDDNNSIAAINRALDLGINWIDTAAVYGLGHSEEVVARALRGRPEKPYIFTKCGLVWGEDRQTRNDLTQIKREVEDSLRRLQVDVIDLYQIHWPVPDEQIEQAWEAMAQIQQEGKVRYIGASNFNVNQLKRAMRIAPVASLQPPYSLIKRDVEQEILPFCLENNIGVIVYSPMQSGLLSGKMTPRRISEMPDDDWRKKDSEFQEPRLSRNLKLAQILQDIADIHNRSTAEVAIAWTLHNPAVTGAIVGSRRLEQVNETIGAAEFRFTDSEQAEIQKFLEENP